jgi:hypothetical protein
MDTFDYFREPWWFTPVFFLFGGIAGIAGRNTIACKRSSRALINALTFVAVLFLTIHLRGHQPATYGTQWGLAMLFWLLWLAYLIGIGQGIRARLHKGLDKDLESYWLYMR